MTLKKTPAKPGGDLLQGTLDMLVLQALLIAPAHGYTIAQWIERSTNDLLDIEEGTLYPALHRLEERELISAVWEPSENNRRSKVYELNAAGRKQLEAERKQWERFSGAVALILRDA